ncbi:MAG: PAS domain S-box protein [Bacteroidetes bacterium]|nr:MAG: PAS domain S-box protein [Bacteroidota bacterium]
MSKRNNVFSYYFRINLKTIQGRITMPFVLATILSVLILYFSNYYHQQLYVQKNHIQNHIVPVQAECEKLMAMVRQSQYSFSYYLYNPESDSTSEANRLLWRNDINPQRDNIRALLNITKNEEAKSQFTILNRQISEINQIQESIERERKTRQNKRYVHNRVVSELTHAVLDFERTLTNIINLIIKQIKDNQRDIDEQQGWFYYMLFALMLFGFLLNYILGMRMFAVIFGWVREIRDNTEQMSKGNLPDAFKVRDNEFKKLSTYSNTLLENLKALRLYAIEIGKGNFSYDSKLFEEGSPLGTSLNEMGQSLQNVYAEERRRNWITEGLTEFAEIFRTNSQDLDMLCRETLKQLVQYLEIVQGGIFLINRDDEELTFELKATYANNREKFLTKKVPVNDGLLGRVYLEKDKVFLREVPEGYTEIVSGIGSTKPKNLLVIPLLDDEREVQGLMEIATLVELEGYKVDFLEKLAYSLASTIAIASISLRNQKALAELQRSAEKLKKREEESQAMMNEMNDEYQRLEIRALENQRYADRLQAIFKYLPEPLILTDFAGNIQLFNPAAERAWGYKAKDIMGKDYRMLLAPDAHIEFLANSIQASQEGDVVIQPETKLQVVKKDGTKQTLGLQHQELIIEGVLFHIWLFGSLVE